MEEARVSADARKNVVLTDPLEGFPDLQTDLNCYDGFPPPLNFLPSAGLLETSYPLRPMSPSSVNRTNRIHFSHFPECSGTCFESGDHDVTTTTFDPGARCSYATGSLAHNYYPTALGQDELGAYHSEMRDVHGMYGKIDDTHDEYDQDTLRPGPCISAPGSCAKIPDIYGRSHCHPIRKTCEQRNRSYLTSDAAFKFPPNSRYYPKVEDSPAIFAASTHEYCGPPTSPKDYMPSGLNSPLNAPLSREPSFRPAPFKHLYGPDLYPNLPYHRKPTTNLDLQEEAPIYPSHLDHARDILTSNGYAQMYGCHQHTEADIHAQARAFIDRNPSSLNHHISAHHPINQASQDGDICIDTDMEIDIDIDTNIDICTDLDIDTPNPTHATIEQHTLTSCPLHPPCIPISNNHTQTSAREAYRAQTLIDTYRYRPIYPPSHATTDPATDHETARAGFMPTARATFKKTFTRKFEQKVEMEKEEGAFLSLLRDTYPSGGYGFRAERYVEFSEEEKGVAGSRVLGPFTARNGSLKRKIRCLMPWILVLRLVLAVMFHYHPVAYSMPGLDGGDD
ncbi:MAG: hypothetical protein Q9223_007603, partial [Gallowayella weberi]